MTTELQERTNLSELLSAAKELLKSPVALGFAAITANEALYKVGFYDPRPMWINPSKRTNPIDPTFGYWKTSGVVFGWNGVTFNKKDWEQGTGDTWRDAIAQNKANANRDCMVAITLLTSLAPLLPALISAIGQATQGGLKDVTPLIAALAK